MPKREATRRGKAMLRKMKTKGWRLALHENMGWHYRLVCGSIQVYESDDGGRYSTLASNTIPGPGGYPPWTDSKHFKDPNRAVAHQLRLMQEHINGLFEVLNTNIRELEGA
jgi:hypothetical protein